MREISCSVYFKIGANYDITRNDESPLREWIKVRRTIKPLTSRVMP
jgi:hypothetical protein